MITATDEITIQGTVTKVGRWWAVEIPGLGCYTQGRSKADALSMAVAWVRDVLADPVAPVTAEAGDGDSLALAGPARVLLPLYLHHRRIAAGLTLREAAAAMGSDSPNAFARYERGAAMPSAATLSRLLHALGGRLALV